MSKASEKQAAQHSRDLARVRASSPFKVFSSMRYESGGHPENYVNYEQLFATEAIREKEPRNLLDVGSNRSFVLGLMAAYDVTTVDVRQRGARPQGEVCLACDAKRLDLANNSFDLVLSLNSIEHFGLGRYGDLIDLEADSKAVGEMIRVLRPGQWLVFSTTLHKAATTIVFNAHRIYSYKHIVGWLEGSCSLVREVFFSRRRRAFVPYDCITSSLVKWDVYCGCWEKHETKSGSREPNTARRS